MVAFPNLPLNKNPNWILSVDAHDSTSSIWTKPILDLEESENNGDAEQDAFVNLMHELVDDRISQVLEAFAEVNANHPHSLIGTCKQLELFLRCKVKDEQQNSFGLF